MRVKYIGKDLVALTKGKIYDVLSVEKGWYRIMTELGEDYLFLPDVFEIVLRKRSFPLKSTVSPGNR
ncbi:MAG: hypothetical protein IJR48_03780 [Oscillibacter sp.]|nr:hypothetical protein [Oscillibacter sp.]MBQ9617465.1 hypothetical protein [Oscillibacter sp.]